MSRSYIDLIQFFIISTTKNMDRIIIWLIIILLLKFSNAKNSESDMFSVSGDMETVDGEVVGGEQVDGLEDYIYSK